MRRNFIPQNKLKHFNVLNSTKLISLPVRLGGLGIPIYSETCQREFENSQKITQTLRHNIVNQESIYIQDQRAEHSIDLEIKNSRRQHQERVLTGLRSRMTKEQLRGNDVAQMKGGLILANIPAPQR